MTHRPIQLDHLGLSFPHKICFEDFTTEILYGSRIALIGQNGSGKSSLLHILQGSMIPSSGEIHIPPEVRMSHVPQVIEDFPSLSGGQRLNKALTQALSLDPTLLLLDEPTNHLDMRNRKSLMRMLQSYAGTLIIVSHDVELLRQCVDTLWHIEGGRIHIFSGHYDDYLREKKRERTSLEHELAELHRQKKDMHTALMQEQKRAAKSRSKGEKSIRERKWPTVVSDAKARRGEETSGHKQLAIHHRKEELSERLSSLHLAEIIRPTFSLCASDIGHQTLISITDGSVGYADPPLLSNIHLSMMNSDRMALLGENGSGKSTLIKSILNDPALTRSGHWHTPKREDIGYLDQHYGTLSPEQSVLETIHTLVPAWSHQEVRRHLNDFLFRKNEEVNASVSTLSGGEKARLSLAQIAARTPKLLILDELTNNLDLETRAHVIQVLQAYPGTLIVISHDPDFLKAIGIQNAYLINDGTLRTTAFS